MPGPTHGASRSCRRAGVPPASGVERIPGGTKEGAAGVRSGMVVEPETPEAGDARSGRDGRGPRGRFPPTTSGGTGPRTVPPEVAGARASRPLRVSSGSLAGRRKARLGCDRGWSWNRSRGRPGTREAAGTAAGRVVAFHPQPRDARAHARCLPKLPARGRPARFGCGADPWRDEGRRGWGAIGDGRGTGAVGGRGRAKRPGRPRAAWSLSTHNFGRHGPTHGASRSCRRAGVPPASGVERIPGGTKEGAAGCDRGWSWNRSRGRPGTREAAGTAAGRVIAFHPQLREARAHARCLPRLPARGRPARFGCRADPWRDEGRRGWGAIGDGRGTGAVGGRGRAKRPGRPRAAWSLSTHNFGRHGPTHGASRGCRRAGVPPASGVERIPGGTKEGAAGVRSGMVVEPEPWEAGGARSGRDGRGPRGRFPPTTSGGTGPRTVPPEVAGARASRPLRVSSGSLAGRRKARLGCDRGWSWNRRRRRPGTREAAGTAAGRVVAFHPQPREARAHARCLPKLPARGRPARFGCRADPWRDEGKRGWGAIGDGRGTGAVGGRGRAKRPGRPRAVWSLSTHNLGMPGPTHGASRSCRRAGVPPASGVERIPGGTKEGAAGVRSGIVVERETSEAGFRAVSGFRTTGVGRCLKVGFRPVRATSRWRRGPDSRHTPPP
jgi:hypothetical protein